MTKDTKSRQIERELAAVKGNKETLRPKDVVNWAKRNRQSALYSCFEWNDGKAAREFRLWQARRLIALHIVTSSGERKTVALVVDRKSGGGYRKIEDVVRVPALRDKMLQEAMQELRRVQNKYHHLKELAFVFAAIDKVDEKISKTNAA